MQTDTKPEPAAVSGSDVGAKQPELWCCYVRGPDEVHAAASFTDAYKMADEINAMLIKIPKCELSPIVVAYPEIWPWSAEEHAADMAEQAKESEARQCIRERSKGGGAASAPAVAEIGEQA